jgi:hypothetical protein
MNKKKVKFALAFASIAALTGCSLVSNQGGMTPPSAMQAISSDAKGFDFSSLQNGKNTADFNTVCNDVFKWAKDNYFTKYSIVDKFFSLTDYDKQGQLLSDSLNINPYISACQYNISHVEETGINASPEGVNKNKMVVFFGYFGNKKETKGEAYLSVAFKNKVKYVTLKGSFVTPSAH